MKAQEIIAKLPYSHPFLFVESIDSVNDQGLVGRYTFRPDEYFYKGHFKDHPVTPGVILIECMAQLGLVCFGIYLLSEFTDEEIQLAMSSTEIDFLKPVYPGDTVTVISEKIYFRFNKLKCKVKMTSIDNDILCKGTISGMIIPKIS
ncbi:MAG: hydroxymyristoyl-ACP dehydratase [Flavobacterium sp.]|nr:MAG: hydroxymyristoyl-ACP dehydratase [Flavobacterium sp.]